MLSLGDAGQQLDERQVRLACLLIGETGRRAADIAA